mgnify:CR=1 FL=1
MVTVTAIMIILIIIIIIIIIIATTIKMIIIGTPPSTLYLGCSKKKNKGMPLSFCSQTARVLNANFGKAKAKFSYINLLTEQTLFTSDI